MGALAQRMLPRWSMHPFKAKSGGAIEQGNANEDSVISVLRKSLKRMTSGLYDIAENNVRLFGLLCRRGHGYCCSSPDGVFILLKRNGAGAYDIVGMCVLEMKTRGKERTTNELFSSVISRGQFEEVRYVSKQCYTGFLHLYFFIFICRLLQAPKISN